MDNHVKEVAKMNTEFSLARTKLISDAEADRKQLILAHDKYRADMEAQRKRVAEDHANEIKRINLD
jgi:hypothetical protein